MNAGRGSDQMIFEKKERTRSEAKKPGEDEFEFYDSIAGAAYDIYRAKLNEWIAECPDDERAEAGRASEKRAPWVIKPHLRSFWCTPLLSAKVTLLKFIPSAAIPAVGQIFWRETRK